jgi:hypothetical protein
MVLRKVPEEVALETEAKMLFTNPQDVLVERV